jgi:hypothetical protein
MTEEPLETQPVAAAPDESKTKLKKVFGRLKQQRKELKAKLAKEAALVAYREVRRKKNRAARAARRVTRKNFHR